MAQHTETPAVETDETVPHGQSYALEIRFLGTGNWERVDDFGGSLQEWQRAKAAWKSRVEAEGHKPCEERSQWRVRLLTAVTLLEN